MGSSALTLCCRNVHKTTRKSLNDVYNLQMKMALHSTPHQKGEYHGLSKPQAQNGDSMEEVDGH
jgi:hypothetical protein